MKILFAADFSSGTKLALKTLKRLQKKYKPIVYLIYVVSSFWKNWIASGRYEKEALQRLESLQTKFDESDDKKLFVEVGNIPESIILKANKLRTDLILLGSKIHSSGRYKSSTTVEAVARGAMQSVWIVKLHTMKKILCGVDGSPSSAKALEMAIELAQNFDAKLSIIYALPNIDFNPLGLDEEHMKANEVEFKKKKQQEINDFINAFNLANLKVERYCHWGMPANVILDIAEDYSYDLIVIGARGHSLLHHVLIGSTAEKVIRHTPCSLLIVR